MHGLEALTPALALHPGGVDDDFGALDGCGQRCGIAKVRLHRLHLADIAYRLQEACEIRAPHGGPHAPPAPRESAHDVPADKARASENGNQPVAGRRKFSHLRSPRSCGIRPSIGEAAAGVQMGSAQGAGNAPMPLRYLMNRSRGFGRFAAPSPAAEGAGFDSSRYFITQAAITARNENRVIRPMLT